MAASRHTAQHRHAHPKHLRIARQHLASIKVYFFRNAVSHIAVVTGSPVFFHKAFLYLGICTQQTFAKSAPAVPSRLLVHLLVHLLGHLLGLLLGLFTMGVVHKSLLHNRLTISRVSVSTTLKTPNLLTFRQLRSTTKSHEIWRNQTNPWMKGITSGCREEAVYISGIAIIPLPGRSKASPGLPQDRRGETRPRPIL